uniref:Uncharacterized protein n=1 Tax=Tetraselmis chuii TaxID=63592 RepID=A0A7S1WZP9_9CHLO|mmetsp:Transcript_13855/g.24531  ORF Transcript_13855/g.24531 Transcript_13855/m.24531 type:complete len:150 (+) Transcript_13855:253-702(+)
MPYHQPISVLLHVAMLIMLNLSTSIAAASPIPEAGLPCGFGEGFLEFEWTENGEQASCLATDGTVVRGPFTCDGYVEVERQTSPAGLVAQCPEQETPDETPAPVLTNVALNKPTQQSTSGWGGVSSRAVDGGLSGVRHSSILGRCLCCR